jgi:hypothetical protein
VPATATVLRDGAPATVADLRPLDSVTVLSAPLPPTVGQLVGAAGAIPAEQVQAGTSATARR